jgi:hypothetical protein
MSRNLDESNAISRLARRIREDQDANPAATKTETRRRVWDLAVLDAPPAMTQTLSSVEGTFEDACNEARRLFRETGRVASVCAGGGRYWFHVDANGEQDLNTPKARA